MYLTGDTVRLSVAFKDFDGVAVTPDAGTVKLTIQSGGQTIETIEEDGLVAGDTGVYSYDHVTPDAEGVFLYEFSCKNGEKPMKQNGTFTTGRTRA